MIDETNEFLVSFIQLVNNTHGNNTVRQALHVNREA